MGTLTQYLSNAQAATMKSQIEERTGEEVIAAGQLKQGRTPSMAAMVTGAALFEVLRPRRSKSLPKGFALAVTANRVVAFSCLGVGEEDGENYHVVVRGSERGSWPREGVSFESLPGKSDGTLDLCGEAVPVCRPNMDGQLCHHVFADGVYRRESTVVVTAIPEGMAFAPALGRPPEGLAAYSLAENRHPLRRRARRGRRRRLRCGGRPAPAGSPETSAPCCGRG